MWHKEMCLNVKENIFLFTAQIYMTEQGMLEDTIQFTKIL